MDEPGAGCRPWQRDNADSRVQASRRRCESVANSPRRVLGASKRTANIPTHREQFLQQDPALVYGRQAGAAGGYQDLVAGVPRAHRRTIHSLAQTRPRPTHASLFG